MENGIVAKTERFDKDNLLALLNHEGVDALTKKNLKAYSKKRFDGNKVQIQYNFGKEWRKLKMGRISPDPYIGLTTFPSDVRACLAQKYYWDVDIVNAQPVILAQVAKKLGMDCPSLTEYVSNRETILKEISETHKMDRKEAKEICIAVLFGGVRTQHPVLIEMSRELLLLSEKITQIRPDIYQNVLKIKKANALASCLAIFIQNEERLVLASIEEYFHSVGRYFGTLIYDGGLLEKLENETSLPKHYIDACEAFIYTKLGLQISLLVKPLEHSFNFKKDEMIAPNIIIDDAFGAKKFASLMGDNLVLDNGVVYAFDDTTGIWNCEESFIKRLITNAGDKLIFKQMGDCLKIFNFSGNVKATNNLYTKLPDVLPHKNDYFRSRINSSMWKLLFTNGIYDLKTKQFTKGFDPDIIFSYSIPRPYIHERNEEAISFVNNTLFIEPFKNPKVGETLLHYLSRGIFGDYMMKIILVCIGKTNSSKGTLCSFMTSAFGSVVGSFTGDSLLTRGDVEATKSLSWVKQIVNKRVSFSNEITVTKDNPRPINGNLLKTIASGGDEITLRLNFKDECKVVNQSLPAIFVNDLPPISPIDDAIRNRLVAIPYSYSFVDEPTLPFHKKADNDVKIKLSDAKYYDALIHLIIDTMEKWDGNNITIPTECLELREDVAPCHDIKTILEETYDITNDPEDYVVSRELIQFLRKRKVDGSDTKIGTFLTDLGLNKGDKKMGRKKEVVRFGIKKIEDHEFIE